MRVTFDSQESKRALERVLNRTMCDTTWYKIRKNLEMVGCTEQDYPLAFQLIAAINSGRREKQGKIIPIPYAEFFNVWKDLRALVLEKPTENKEFTCRQFVAFIIKGQTYKPQDRIVDGVRVGYNPMWYAWFQSCGLKFTVSNRIVYKLSELMPVVARYYAWKNKQVPKLSDAIFDAEYVEVNNG